MNVHHNTIQTYQRMPHLQSSQHKMPFKELYTTDNIQTIHTIYRLYIYCTCTNYGGFTYSIHLVANFSNGQENMVVHPLDEEKPFFRKCILVDYAHTLHTDSFYG